VPPVRTFHNADDVTGQKPAVVVLRVNEENGRWVVVAMREGEAVSSMQAFELADLRARQAAGDRLYLEFLRVPALSTGLYVLPAGGTDPQKPHTEDEVYYVISGRARFTCEGREIAVRAGTTIYVAAGDAHRFSDIEEELVILVFFAPAEAV
jgi:mannose-6-phosphate isomerase-like protein (cupin superfamily)